MPTQSQQHIILPITGLDCADCAIKLQSSITQMSGVASATVDFAASTLTTEFDPQQVPLTSLLARVHDLGYDVPLQELTLELEGLDCADCATKLQRALMALPGIIEAEVTFATAQLHVHGVAGQALEPAVVHQVAELGYTARRPASTAERAAPRVTNWRARLSANRRTVLTVASGVFLAAAALLHALSAPEAAVTVCYALSMLCGGFYVARSGWAMLRTTHSLDMNALMTIAALGAIVISQWAEGATAMFLFSLGNTLEALSMDRARGAIRKLMDLTPREATRIHGDHADRVPIEQLRLGDLIEVKPGERVPMDGAVEQGSSALNQAPITGESSPVDVQPGSSVFAGSINGQGALLVHVTKLAQDNTLARIVQMVQEAQSQRAPAQRFVDTFSRYYTPAVIALAVGIAIVPPVVLSASFATWFYRALVLLVISCPCALVISTPVAIVSAISNAARHGALVKGGAHLENIARVRAVAFDKTGTLTEGRPAVLDVEPCPTLAPSADGEPAPQQTADGLLALAAALEIHSQHPIARSIVEEARRRMLTIAPVTDYQDLPGHGGQARFDGHTYLVGNPQLFAERVPGAQATCERAASLEAEGKTVVLVGNDVGVLGLIGVADRPRDDSRGVVQTLRRMGLDEIVLLSGDNERTAQAIARAVGISQFRANLLPQDKVTAIEALLAQSGRVAMVGDGVNDAPALARASVGIAMGAAGSDAALETADIVLMSDDLRRIPYIIHLGRRTLRNIQQNIVLSLVIKGVFLLLAVAGMATLWMAVFADMGTSLIVTFNGMRLLRER